MLVLAQKIKIMLASFFAKFGTIAAVNCAYFFTYQENK